MQTTELTALETGSLAAEVVFGSIDGIFSVLGIIAAGATAGLEPLQIFATGLGGAAAGALSVFAAMYLSQTTEKKTRLLAAWENSRKVSTRRVRNGNSQIREPTKKEHKMFHELLSRVHRRALLSGLVTSTTSTVASLALLLPLAVVSQFYAPTQISLLIGLFLIALLGAFRGITLKQSAAKSAIKMVTLGVIIIIASRVLGQFVLTLLKG
ncbi:MAG TPA: VIT1/CCC1 transporter family protein [Candidatus Dormibacteraeota bacterium]|nr:VIT1/CCC1 transporter family protein [Candidatus Dormibacteraeota bacterium]